MAADDNINYLRKFVMLNSTEDCILIHNLHVHKSTVIKINEKSAQRDANTARWL